MSDIVYVSKPVEVEAIQFRGWQTTGGLEALFTFAAELNPFFVPTGYEHGLRTKGEYDRSRGDILGEARPYLVLSLNNQQVRFDEYDWLVKNASGKFSIVSGAEFNATYDKKSELVISN